jgi:small-conductance mechanosensitive channel
MATRETQVEQIKQDEDVQRALKQTTPVQKAVEARPVSEAKEKLLLGTHALVLVALGSFYYLTTLRFFGFAAQYLPLIHRLTRGTMAVVLVLAVEKLVNAYAICRVDDVISQYNLRRILRLVVFLIIAFIAVSVLFANWYTAVVSLGLISLILGLALQTPITSFFAWIYILIRSPYRIGDRIKIGDLTGDVIDVSYLDTTLWEFGGDYLSTDHPSGRVIKFPNSNVLNSSVINYTWPVFPYIWNEIKFQIAYDSDLEFVARIMQEVAEEEIGEGMMERVRVYRDLLAQTPVDELQVRERPSVQFRVSENTWVEAICRYLVNPREAGRVKTRLIKKMLEKMNAEPDRALFPKSNMR